MNDYSNRLLLPGRRPNWFQRVLLALAGVVLVIGAFFFITVALVAGAILALAVGIRLWWVMRRVRAAAKAHQPLEGEYRVVSPTAHQASRIER